MYFLEQLQSQFLMSLASYEVTPEGPGRGGDDETQTAPPVQTVSIERQRQLDTLDEIKAELEGIQASEQILGQRLHIIGGHLENDKNLDSQDPEFTQLREMYTRILEEYRLLTQEQQQVDHIIRFRLAEFTQEVEEVREAIVSGESQEDIDFRLTHEGREAFLQTLESDTQMSDAELQALVREFGAREIHLWIQDLGNQIAESDDTNEQTLLQQRIERLQQLMALIDERSFENMDMFGTLSDTDFISQIPQGQRLPYFVRGNVDIQNLSAGQDLEMTFTYQGIHNRDLERLTAGQVFPETISSLVVDGVEYTRRGLLGEFYSEASNNTPARRLFIRESETLQIGNIRSVEDMRTQREAIETQLAGVPEAERDVQLAALERGLGTLDSGTLRVLRDALPGVGVEGRAPNIETRVTDLAERVGPRQALDLEGLRSSGLLGAILATILELFSGENGAEFAARTGENFSSYAGGIGISPADIERYGNTGAQLAQWLQSSGYPVYNGQPFYCGANVGAALDAFGIRGLPTSGRHGYAWAEICRSRPNQFQRLNCTPQEAPAGAIISYNRGTGGSVPRQNYGHVEIALGQNRGYYFGQVTRNPGGSNPGFAAGTYEIYMPTSMT